LPGLEGRRAAVLERQVFTALAMNALEVARFLHRPASDLQAMVSVRGLEHVEEARARGRGLVVASGHLGAWELFAGFFAPHVPLTVVTRPLKDPRFESLLGRLRSRLGVRTVSVGDGARPLLAALAAGGAVGILCDQAREGSGAWVPFFGRPAWFSVGPARLAQHTGAALLVGGIRRLGAERHEVTFSPAVAVDGDDGGESLVRATAGVAGAFEGLVRRSLDQWTWMYDPWSGPRGGGAG
jgi:Kdo2-lipid IVA lauroyltransferase/acyltransferase